MADVVLKDINGESVVFQNVETVSLKDQENNDVLFGAGNIEPVISRTATSIVYRGNVIGSYAFYMYDTLQSLVATNLTNVQKYGVFNCSVPSIDISLNGTISQYGFANLYNLQYADFSKSNITDMGAEAFSGTGRRGKTKTKIDLTNSSFTQVGIACFVNAQGLSIYLPSTVERILQHAFNVASASSIYFCTNNPPTATSNSFNNLCSIRVPWDSIYIYKNDSSFGSFASQIIGYATTTDFSPGDQLPSHTTDEKEIQWYSDESLTKVITIFPQDVEEVYCNLI